MDCFARRAYAARPPDTAGPFIRHHAWPDRRARRAGTAVKCALVGIDPAEHDTRAIATGRHLAGTFAHDVVE